MLPADNVTRRGIARGTLVLGLAASCLMSLAALGWAQEAAEIPPQPLDAAYARQGFDLAAQWVKQGRVTDSPIPIRVTNLSGLEVTLRMDGLAVGRSRVLVEQPLEADQAHDLAKLLERAVDAALTDAAATIRKVRLSSSAAAAPLAMSQIAPRLRLELQVAHTPERLVLETLDELPRRFVLGGEALAVKRGEKLAMAFPAAVPSTGQTLQTQLYRLLAELELPATQLGNIGQENGPPAFRAQVIHLVQLEPGNVVSLSRGRLGPPTMPGLKQLQDLSERWAVNLSDRQGSNGMFAGTYHPQSGKYDPLIAPATDSALAIYALARYARLNQIDTAPRGRAAATARLALIAVLQQINPRNEQGRMVDPGPLFLAPTAMTLLALIETPGSADLKHHRDRLAGALIAMQQPEGSFANRTGPNAGDASAASQALACYAMVRLYEQTREPAHLESAERARRTIWKDLEYRKIVATMPWLAMAEFDLARLGRPTTALPALRDAAEQLWKAQVQPGDDRGPLDTVGGFLLDATIIPEPTWQTTRPLAALAVAPRVDRFVAEEARAGWLVKLSRGMGYLDQLTLTPVSAYYAPSTRRAGGGVTQAMWDSRQPIAATAMALLAAAELQHTLDELVNR